MVPTVVRSCCEYVEVGGIDRTETDVSAASQDMCVMHVSFSCHSVREVCVHRLWTRPHPSRPARQEHGLTPSFPFPPSHPLVGSLRLLLHFNVCGRASFVQSRRSPHLHLHLRQVKCSLGVGVRLCWQHFARTACCSPRMHKTQPGSPMSRDLSRLHVYLSLSTMRRVSRSFANISFGVRNTTFPWPTNVEPDR